MRHCILHCIFSIKLLNPASVISRCTYYTLYCIVCVHLYSAYCSAHQSEALPMRETQREESSVHTVQCSQHSMLVELEFREGRPQTDNLAAQSTRIHLCIYWM